MNVCSSMCTKGATRQDRCRLASATLRRALDAEPRRRHRLQARVGDALVARFALAVGAVGELRQRVLDVLEGLVELTGQRLDLAPLGGDLARVGEVLVELERPAVPIGGGPVAEVGELLTNAVALVLELVAQQLLRRLGHPPSLPPTPSR